LRLQLRLNKRANKFSPGFSSRPGLAWQAMAGNALSLIAGWLRGASKQFFGSKKQDLGRTTLLLSY
jgi:hypothetical protein